MEPLNEVICPHCGAEELDPTTRRLAIRVWKVFTKGEWWSHCLKCDKWFT